MSVHLVLSRHGETVWHAENRYAGATDVELTPRGAEQARALAAWAAAVQPTAVWSSPLRRARDTASAAAQEAGVPLEVDERLVELDFGIAEGLTRAEMDGRFPDDLAAFKADPVGHHFPEGEPPTVAVERYLGVLRDLESRYSGQRVLVVAHSTALRLILCQLLGVPLAHYRRVFPHLVNCALTEILFHGDSASLLSLNRPVDEAVAGLQRGLSA